MRILELLGSGVVGTEEGVSNSLDVLELCNHFVRLGHEVVMADVRSTKCRTLLAAGVKLVEVDTPPAIDTLGKPRHLGKFAQGVWDLLSRYRHSRAVAYKTWEMLGHYRYLRAVASRLSLDNFDIIHCHDGKQALLLQKLYRRPYVYSNHWHFMPGDSTINARIERIIVKGAQVAVGLGGYLKQFAPEGNIEVIPNGIDLEKWRPLDQKTAREALGLSETDFILLFIGNVDERKGADILIEAVRLLAPEIRRLKLCVIGPLGQSVDGTSIDDCAKCLMDQARELPVKFLGFLNNTSLEFQRYLSAADVFVLPTRSDAQPRVVLEALAMGKPVIASDVGGVGEMVTEEVGHLFQAGDSPALASKISDLYENPAKLETMRSSCRSYVEREYSWGTAAERHIAAFEGCIEVHRRGAVSSA